MKTLNVKEGYPKVEEAREKLYQCVNKEKKGTLVKVVHGYGSTGAGGKIKMAFKKSLRNLQKQGRIEGYLFGESADLFDGSSRNLLDSFPFLAQDSDFISKNEGVTFIKI